MLPVIMYTTPTCGYCRLAKKFFQENNVAYSEKDVVRDPSARNEMLEKTGQLGVPVFEIGDAVLIGFSEGKLRELIGL